MSSDLLPRDFADQYISVIRRRVLLNEYRICIQRHLGDWSTKDLEYIRLRGGRRSKCRRRSQWKCNTIWCVMFFALMLCSLINASIFLFYSLCSCNLPMNSNCNSWPQSHEAYLQDRLDNGRLYSQTTASRSLHKETEQVNECMPQVARQLTCILGR